MHVLQSWAIPKECDNYCFHPWAQMDNKTAFPPTPLNHLVSGRPLPGLPCPWDGVQHQIAARWPAARRLYPFCLVNPLLRSTVTNRPQCRRPVAAVRSFRRHLGIAQRQRRRANFSPVLFDAGKPNDTPAAGAGIHETRPKAWKNWSKANPSFPMPTSIRPFPRTPILSSAPRSTKAAPSPSLGPTTTAQSTPKTQKLTSSCERLTLGNSS